MDTSKPSSPLDRWFAAQVVQMEARIADLVDLEAGMSDLAFRAQEETVEAGIQNLVDVEGGLSDLMGSGGKPQRKVVGRASTSPTSGNLSFLVAEVVQAIRDLALSVELFRGRLKPPSLVDLPLASATLGADAKTLRVLATRLAKRNITKEKAVLRLAGTRQRIGAAIRPMRRVDPRVEDWWVSFTQRLERIVRQVEVIFDESGDSVDTPWTGPR